MYVMKQQLELDMEKQTGSKQEKEYVKAVPKTCEYVTLYGGCDEVKEFEMGRLSWWAQCNHQHLYTKNAGGQRGEMLHC